MARYNISSGSSTDILWSNITLQLAPVNLSRNAALPDITPFLFPNVGKVCAEGFVKYWKPVLPGEEVHSFHRTISI